MRSLFTSPVLLLIAGCSMTTSPEPSLAPRPAEAIDPRLPIADEVAAGTLDPALADRLSALVAQARAAEPAFDARASEASQAAARAGPVASEGWIAAELALSRLVEQYGVTTRVAADIDALASQRLEAQRWITPTDREAIAAAASEVGSISSRQAATIERIKNQLAR